MSKLIGTAGHVDHGKTTLIRALTGIDADRLPEEKERGMTIDIGFAYIDFPTLGRVSIVDVPGHERFIHNMLVGALGIDVALLCVAADEGVKPQTVEHLQILELLQAGSMVVALTRADLADPDTRELARMDVEELLRKSRFEGAPIIEVSAETGEGLQDLNSELEKALSGPSRNNSEQSNESQPGKKTNSHSKLRTQDSGLHPTHSAQSTTYPWYLPIDRAFSVKGHGCVVTGTLARGAVHVGERAVIEPGHIEVRIRAIHSHGEAAESSEFGRRTALNLGGAKVEDLHRGQSIGAEGALFETRIFDAAMRWAGAPKHAQRVRVSIGADEVIGKLFLNDLEPNVVQLRLEREIACAKGQPFLIRRYSPPEVLGGGNVLVPVAKMRRKKENPTVVNQKQEDTEAILTLLGDNEDGLATGEICRLMGQTPQQLGTAFEKLLNSDSAYGFAGLWLSKGAFDTAEERFLLALNTLHAGNPALGGIQREKVVSEAGLRWSGKPLDRILAALASEDKIELNGTQVRHRDFKVQLSPKQAAFVARVLEELEKGGVNTPYPSDLARSLKVPPQAIEEILKLGTASGSLVRVAEDVYYGVRQLDGIKVKLSEMFGDKPFAASEFRDAIRSSRKYVIPLLEYFDSVGFTLRVGDKRVVKN